MTSDKRNIMIAAVSIFTPLRAKLHFASGWRTRVFFIFVVLILFPQYTVRGDDDWDFKEPVRQHPNLRLVRQRQQLTDQQIDQYIYGQYGTVSMFKARMESLLTLQVESVERVASLSGVQKQKLLLAGHGDMKKFYREVDQIKKKCESFKNDPQGINKIWPIIQPLQIKMRSEFFDDTSLFKKVVKRTLDAEQAEKYEKQELQRRKFRYQATIELVVTMLEEGVPLRDQQRQKFIKILLEDTPPPRKFGQYDQYYVYFQTGKVRDKLKPNFDDAQWRTLDRVFGRGEAMEAHLKSQGILP